MRCTPINLGNGAGVIVCTSGRSRACSTPGCGGSGTKLCDHPVDRRDPPKRGDVRMHRERNVLYYVWSVAGDRVTISTKPPGRHGGVHQTVSLADWFAKSLATCDRPICARCAVSVGPDRDYCPPHARQAKETP